MTHWQFRPAACALLVSTFVSPAAALDCSKAVAPVDKAICANPAASAADQELDSAYSALSSRDAPADKKLLLQSQRKWLKQRIDTCTEDKKPSVKCLIEQTELRSRFLQGKPETGPGTGHDLVPIFIAQTATKTLYEQDIVVSKFASPTLPGEKLFNQEIDKLLKDAPSAKTSDDQRDMTYEYDLTLRVTYASPRFLSASFETYTFEGGAHGASGVSGIAIDVVKGKRVQFDDLFETAARPMLADLCFTQIKTQKKEKDMDLEGGLYTVEQLRKTIDDGLIQMERWSFSASQGTLSFDPYELGAYVEGFYTCTFQNEVLRPFYKPDSILP